MRTFYDDKHYFSESTDPRKEIQQLLASFDYTTLGIVVDRNLPEGDAWSWEFPGAVFIERRYGGEEVKHFSTLLSLANTHQRKLDTNSLICVIGGGALLDLVGLTCGLMYRGIRYVSVPTTVIAMADSAYGGKTAINLEARNQLGMYHHPELVYLNPHFLASLPEPFVRSGLIEIAKLAIFFPDIRDALDEFSATHTSISTALLIAATRKLELLAQDPFEEKAASVLLYGHPFSNAFEAAFRERTREHVPHGFAVAMGILFSEWLVDRLFPGEKPAKDLHFLTRWVDPIALAREVTPSSGRELSALLLRDKYASGAVLRVPAIRDQSGYSEVAMTRISTEYDLWRGSLLGSSSERTTKASRTQVIQDALGAYIAGAPSDETVAPLRFAGADGPFLITTDSRRILDWSTCLNAPFGHSCRPETAGLPINSGNYRTEQRDALVNRLKGVFPHIGGFQFRSSGTEAVEASLRYLRAALGPSTQMVAIEGCYHGLTLGARGLMGTEDAGMRRTELPFSSLNQPAALEKLEALLQDGPVAIWLEGVQGATLRRLPGTFLVALGELRGRHPRRLAVVADDMLASIRCGDWCSLSPHLEPDIVVAGKSWANGYPFSFFGVAPWIRAAGGDILGTTTYGGNPVSCANAVYTIDRIIESDLLNRTRAREPMRKVFFAETFSRRPGVVRTEWHGLLFGLELSGAALGLATARTMAAAGVLVSQLGPVIRCSPSLDIPDELLDEGLAVLARAIPGA